MSQFEPFLALEASAGSGKTFALSVRFVALILKGAKINEILALTFTKKAANEMQKRVIDTFLNLEFENKKSERKVLCEFLGLDEKELIFLRDSRKNEFLRTELKISTFDSFFGKILRVFALNFGLSSDFVLREEKLDVREIFIKILDLKALKDLAFYVDLADEKEQFFNELEKFYENAYFKECSLLKSPSKERINHTYQNLREQCFKLNLSDINAKNLESLQKNFISEKLNLSEFLESNFMVKFQTTKYLQDLDEKNAEFHLKRVEFFDALNDYANELQAYKIANLMNLLKFYSKAKDKIHKEKNVLNFQDVSKKVYELICSEFREMIYFRIDGYVSHLLIDEFQDTSVIQYQILKPLIAELVSGEGVKKNRTFFYVGDKKQSIYRFRNSKKELFDLPQLQFPQLKKDNLTTNYRSKSVLVDFFNEIFRDKIKDYKDQFALDSKNGGFVRVVETSEQKLATGKNQSDEIKQKTLQALLEQIQFLKSKGVAENEICILCWVNNDADMILDFLKEQNIPAFTESNVLLENKASVKIVLEYIKYCLFGDEFYRVFLEEILGFSPRKIELDFSKSAAQTVLFLANELRLEIDIALIQYIEYAKTKETFLKLIFEPCPLKILSEQNLGISIMSVHKSKGLEFEHVILLDKLSKNSPNINNILLEYDIQQGWQLCIKDKIRGVTQDNAYVNFLKNIEKLNFEDDMNKLYVAFTRAKESLIILKRNERCVNGNYPSYFAGEFLNLLPQERGNLESKEQQSKDNGNQISCLQKFEKIDRQELPQSQILEGKELYFGNAFHFFMQNLKLPSGQNFDLICEKTRANFRYFLDEDEFQSVFKRIKNLLQDVKFQNLIFQKQIFKEQSFGFNGEIKRIDLLAMSDENACILEYKTSALKQNSHIKQVEFYKNAMNEILKGKKIMAFLVYCLDDGVQILEI